MNPQNYWLRWRASSGHPGGWRVTRYEGVADNGHPHTLHELEGSGGRVTLFRHRESAERRAAALNEAEHRE